MSVNHCCSSLHHYATTAQMSTEQLRFLSSTDWL